VQINSANGDGMSECLKALLACLDVPVAAALKQHDNGDVPGCVELGIKLNIWHTIEELVRKSSVLKQSILDGKLEIHGGVYCLENGHIDWMGQHPEQQKLLDGSDCVTCGVCAN